MRVLEVDVLSANLSEVITGVVIGWPVAGGPGGPCGKLCAADSEQPRARTGRSGKDASDGEV